MSQVARLFFGSLVLLSCTTIEEILPVQGYGTFCGSDASAGGAPADASSTGGTVSAGGTDASSTGGSDGSSVDAGETGGSCSLAPASFVQLGVQDQWGSYQAVTAEYLYAQTEGNLNVVAINWNDATHSVSTVVDTLGNSYTKAIGPTRSGQFTSYVYFAPNIRSGSNSVTVTMNGSVAYPDLRVFEYSGFSASVSVQAANGAVGTSVTSTVSGMAASAPGQLIVFTGATEHKFIGAVSPALSRIITPHDIDISGDLITTEPGTYSVSATNNVSSEWAMQAVSFTGNAQNCGGSGGASGQSYSTNFDLTENPVSESSNWEHIGLDWTQVSSANGLAFGTQTGSNGFDDSYAILSGFSANQQASGVLHIDSSIATAPHHETEILLRFADGPHIARGYECNLAWNGAYATIVRWNGAKGDFATLKTVNGLTVHNGDTFSASVVGTTITMFLNNTSIGSVSDATWTTGNPGIGFYRNSPTGAFDGDFAFTSFSASDVP